MHSRKRFVFFLLIESLPILAQLGKEVYQARYHMFAYSIGPVIALAVVVLTRCQIYTSVANSMLDLLSYSGVSRKQ